MQPLSKKTAQRIKGTTSNTGKTIDVLIFTFDDLRKDYRT
jgi:hypothetical protein